MRAKNTKLAKGANEAKPEVSDFIKRRESRVLRLARARLFAASSRMFEANPKAARWFCLEVLPNSELSVDRLLTDCGVETFVPRETVTVVRKGEKLISDRAVMPGYVLVKVLPSVSAFDGLKQQRNVFGFVGGSTSYHVVRDVDVAFMQDLRSEDVSRMPVDKTISEGTQVRITHGPFYGFSAVVLQVFSGRNSRGRLQVRAGNRVMEIKSMPLAFCEKL